MNPAGEGWWPVLSVELANDWLKAVIMGAPGQRDLVVCFYQLQGDRIVGWWVDAESLGSALI